MFTFKTIERFLTETECEDIIKYSISNYELHAGRIKGRVMDENVRKSNIVHINYDIQFPGFSTRLKNLITPMFDLKGVEIDNTFESTFQFTEYSQGDFYDWHTDSINHNIELSNKRYCSIVIQLNNEYEGGDLEMKPFNEPGDVIVFKRGIGNLFIFLSDIEHRVSPVISGVRHSIVGWFYLKNVNDYKKTLI